MHITLVHRKVVRQRQVGVSKIMLESEELSLCDCWTGTSEESGTTK